MRCPNCTQTDHESWLWIIGWHHSFTITLLLLFRSFSQKRAAVERDYAQVSKSQLLVSCSLTSLLHCLFVCVAKTTISFYITVIQRHHVTVLLWSENSWMLTSHTKNPHHNRERNIHWWSTGSFPPRCLVFARSFLKTSIDLKIPPCLAGAVEVLQPCEECPPPLWREGARPELSNEQPHMSVCSCASAPDEWLRKAEVIVS